MTQYTTLSHSRPPRPQGGLIGLPTKYAVGKIEELQVKKVPVGRRERRAQVGHGLRNPFRAPFRDGELAQEPARVKVRVPVLG